MNSNKLNVHCPVSGPSEYLLTAQIGNGILVFVLTDQIGNMVNAPTDISIDFFYQTPTISSQLATITLYSGQAVYDFYGDPGPILSYALYAPVPNEWNGIPIYGREY